MGRGQGSLGRRRKVAAAVEPLLQRRACLWLGRSDYTCRNRSAHCVTIESHSLSGIRTTRLRLSHPHTFGSALQCSILRCAWCVQEDCDISSTGSVLVFFALLTRALTCRIFRAASHACTCILCMRFCACCACRWHCERGRCTIGTGGMRKGMISHGAESVFSEGSNNRDELETRTYKTKYRVCNNFMRSHARKRHPSGIIACASSRKMET